MNKTTYKDLAIAGNKFLKFCENNLHINQNKLRNNWIIKAIELTKGLDNALKQGEGAKKRYLSEFNKNAECLLLLTYLYELKDIFKNVTAANTINTLYFTDKIKRILNASLLISQEDTNSNEARNYLFELLFLSDLLACEYKANIGNAHPDIKVKINSHNYAIECKRIFKKETFLKNFKDAKEQLEKYSLSKSEYEYGIIAIDVSRPFIVKKSENLLLRSKNRVKANNKALDELELFFNQFKQNLYDNYNPKIPALILHLSVSVVLENQKPFLFWGHYLMPCELSNNSQVSLFYLVKQDFARLNHL